MVQFGNKSHVRLERSLSIILKQKGGSRSASLTRQSTWMGLFIINQLYCNLVEMWLPMKYSALICINKIYCIHLLWLWYFKYKLFCYMIRFDYYESLTLSPFVVCKIWIHCIHLSKCRTITVSVDCTTCLSDQKPR